MQAAYADKPHLFQNWRFELIDPKVLDHPYKDTILRAYAYYDNIKGDSSYIVKSNDCERLLSIWQLLNSDKYVGWKDEQAATVRMLQNDLV